MLLDFQWNLVCRRSYLVSLTKSVAMAGMMVGAGLGGPIADRYGVYSFTLKLNHAYHRWCLLGSLPKWVVIQGLGTDPESVILHVYG